MNLSNAGRRVLWFAIGGIALWLVMGLGALGVLGIVANGPPRLHLTVRSYAVAPEVAGEMQSALSQILNAPPYVYGRVTMASNGHLLVTAPDSVQRDVQAIIQDVASQKPGPTPTIKFEVWLVSAASGAVTKADDGAGLAEIAAALGDIQKTQQGPETLRFNLLEKLSVQARAGGNESYIEGARADLEISNTTVRLDSKGLSVIAARIELHQGKHELKAVVELPAGQLLVLGQTSTLTAGAGPPGQLYYLVRASL